MSQTTIFLTGATGYIGGTVLARLFKHPKFSSFHITALVRNKEKATKLQEFGVKAVVGSNSDLEILETQASEADIVIAVSDADNLEATQTILRGIKKRYAKTGKVPTLIHTSGTGVFAEFAGGMYASETIYSDTDVKQIAGIADTQPHRNVDLAILAADTEGYVKTHLVLPSTVYGLAKGPLVDADIQNPRSVQIPWLIKASLDKGQGCIMGEGKNVWPHVHIDDLADLYIILLDTTLTGTSDHGLNGYYFGENGEYSYFEVSKAVSEALIALGVSKSGSPEPVSLTDEESTKYFGIYAPFFGTNSRARADHSRSIGWKPMYTTKDLLASIKPEVEAIINSK